MDLSLRRKPSMLFWNVMLAITCYALVMCCQQAGKAFHIACRSKTEALAAADIQPFNQQFAT